MKKAKGFLRRLHGYKTILGSILIHLTLGNVYCFPNISMYIISYMKLIGGCNVQYKDSSWICVINLIFQCFFGFCGGQLNDVLGATLSVLLGSWLMCVGILLSYFTVYNFYLFLITYGIIYGIGCGIVYPIPLSVAVRKHYSYKGMVRLRTRPQKRKEIKKEIKKELKKEKGEIRNVNNDI